MKRSIFCILAFLLSFQLQAQLNQPLPPKQQSPVVPPFHILKADSASYFTNTDLKKNRETIIMYFSPECDHCKHQTKDIIESIDKLKNIEIVMATYFPFGEMKEFYKLNLLRVAGF